MRTEASAATTWAEAPCPPTPPPAGKVTTAPGHRETPDTEKVEHLVPGGGWGLGEEWGGAACRRKCPAVWLFKRNAGIAARNPLLRPPFPRTGSHPPTRASGLSPLCVVSSFPARAPQPHVSPNPGAAGAEWRPPEGSHLHVGLRAAGSRAVRPQTHTRQPPRNTQCHSQSGSESSAIASPHAELLAARLGVTEETGKHSESLPPCSSAARQPGHAAPQPHGPTAESLPCTLPPPSLSPSSACWVYLVKQNTLYNLKNHPNTLAV